jgi:hypothetical protein
LVLPSKDRLLPDEMEAEAVSVMRSPIDVPHGHPDSLIEQIQGV